MKTLNIFAIILIFTLSGCTDDWMDKKSKTIITEEQVWNDQTQILSLLGNYYDRLPMLSGFGTDTYTQWYSQATFDDAMWSGYLGNDGLNNLFEYPINLNTYWDYNLVRDINIAIENIKTYSKLSDATKIKFDAEFRFLRAFVYFEMVKRMGGVPLVDHTLIYDFSGDPSSIQIPRAKEFEIYDFIANEVDSISGKLGNTGSSTRANKYTALALKSRAMLYAGSIAKYNNLMPLPITTANEEVGMPASKANDYYTKSLQASLEIINSKKYSLYKKNLTNLGENFYQLFMDKNSNSEVIFVKDFSVSKDKRHWFTYYNIARSVREDNVNSSSLSPSLNLVESFDYLNGQKGSLKIRTADNSDYIYYDNLSDIFSGKDARLYGTIIYPGTRFRELDVQIQAGVKVWDQTTSTYKTIEGKSLGVNHTDGLLLTGSGGPHRTMQEVTNTGFYMRKFISSSSSASTRTNLSDNFWVWYRLGEIYLNASEAAFELNMPEAKDYINILRERAGFPTNSISVLTNDIIRNERRVELAYEDHRYFDLKRWRIADKVWDGNQNNTSTMIYALYPYRVIRPGDPRDGKYVFEKFVAPRFRSPRYFKMSNYYSEIPRAAINNNPKIVPNPFH